MTSPRKLSPRRLTTAFSLIEVVMSIAIVAFALVAIAGTMPVGLQSMRDSQNDQAFGTIETQLRGDLQQISFSSPTNSVQTLVGTNYYYTVEGVPTVYGSTTMPAYYRAQFAVTNASVNGNAYVGTANAPTNAATVTVILSYPCSLNPAPLTNSFSIFAAAQTGL